MDYQGIIKKCDESKYLISMISIDEIIRFGYSIGLNENSNVLDLCCGYGEVLKIWNQAFNISGTGVDIDKTYIAQGQERLKESNITKIQLINEDVTIYTDQTKYDVVICSETLFDSIDKTLAIGEKFLKLHGILGYCKVYSKIPNPPEELKNFDGELFSLAELNKIFNELGYYITYMASDSTGDWERYITWSARRDIDALLNNPEDEKLKAWIDKWYNMYFSYRRPFEGQTLFGLERLSSRQK